MSTCVLGLDVGTTEVKVLVLDVGTRRASRTVAVPYPSTTTPDGGHEQDADEVWRAVRQALTQAVAPGNDPGPQEIVGVGLSGHMHSLLLVGPDDRPVRPVMTWADRRVGLDTARLARDPRFRERTGNDVVDAFTAPKLAWLAREHPQDVARATRLVLVKDYVGFLLTGEWLTDPTDAMGTLLWDARERRWDPELLELCGGRSGLVVPVAPSAAVRGTVTARAAAQTGLPAGLPVAVGAGDVPGTALGVGVRDASVVGMNVGTAAQVVGVVPGLEPGDGFVFGAALGTGFLSMASVYAAGAAVDHVRRLVGDDDGSLLRDQPGVPPGSEGLTCLPYLFGTAAPVKDDAARGALLGLGARHGRAHLVAATLEGVAFACADALDTVVRACGRPAALHVAGGVSQSARWCAALASVVDVPVVRVRSGGSPMGAAVLGALACGAVRDADELVAALDAEPLGRPGVEDAERYVAARDRFVQARDRLVGPKSSGEEHGQHPDQSARPAPHG